MMAVDSIKEVITVHTACGTENRQQAKEGWLKSEL